MLVVPLRFLRGYVSFCVKGKFPERFLNITNKYGIGLWGVTPVDGGFEAFMYVSDYKTIRTTARKSRVTLKIKEKYGLPFLAEKYKPRAGLAVGFVAGILIMLVLSNFVWSISVLGAENISDTYIRQVLSDNGVDVGVYKNNIDVDKIARDTILKIDEIGWMSLNITGNLISVEIKEKVKKPDIDKNTNPCNIKAKADGVVTNIKVTSGTTKVLKGSGVAKGDLLVSGITELKTDALQYVRANGEIFADVTYSKKTAIPKEYNYAYLSDNKINRKQLGVLWSEFPCSISFDSYSEFVSVINTENLFVNDTVLPLKIKTQTDNEVLYKKAIYDKAKAKKIFENEALLYEVFEKSDGALVDRKFNIVESKTEVLCQIDYVFNENIAEKIDFSVTE